MISDQELVEPPQGDRELPSFLRPGVGENDIERVPGAPRAATVAFELDRVGHGGQRLASVVWVGSGGDPACTTCLPGPPAT